MGCLPFCSVLLSLPYLASLHLYSLSNLGCKWPHDCLSALTFLLRCVPLTVTFVYHFKLPRESGQTTSSKTFSSSTFCGVFEKGTENTAHPLRSNPIPFSSSLLPADQTVFSFGCRDGYYGITNRSQFQGLEHKLCAQFPKVCPPKKNPFSPNMLYTYAYWLSGCDLS